MGHWRGGMEDGDETIPGTSGSGAGSSGEPAGGRAVGSVVAEDYCIEGRLGVGGMGVVYLARHTKLDRRVAIKELFSSDGVSSERLLREAMAMARLDHPNVVRIFDARQLGDRLFIAMEYLPAGTLQQWCSQRRRTVTELVDVFAGAAEGLAAAHAQGIVHRDFKPQNVLMTATGVPKVGDFGIARAGTTAVALASTTHDGDRARPVGDRALPELTVTGSLLGTPAYMAPEQYEGRADERSDQFAFCVTLYEALYGQRPFQGDTPPQLWAQSAAGRVLPPPPRTDVPRSVFKVLRRGLAPNPDRRFRSLPSLVRALRRACAPKGPLIAALTGSALLAIAAIAIAVRLLVWPDPSPPPVRSNFAGLPESSRARVDEASRPVPDVTISGDLARPHRGDTDGGAGEGDEDPPVIGSLADLLAAKPRRWDASRPLVCTDRLWASEVRGTYEGPEPLILAQDGCDLRCADCELQASRVVEATGGAHVEFQSGSITSLGTGAAVLVHDDAAVTFRRTELRAPASRSAVEVRGDGHLFLDGASVTATTCLVMRGSSTATVSESTLVAAEGEVVVRTGPDTSLRQWKARYVGKLAIEGGVENIKSGRH